MEAKRWTKFTIGSTYAVLAAFGLCTAVIDPLFHYHRPLSFLSYPLHNQRYQNDGILRHFDYDAIIIGTSMTENFKTSEFDRLWNVSSIKVPFNGGHYKEMDRAVRQGLKNNPNIKYVLRCLDYYFLDDKNTIRTDVEYPEYLYNDNLFDDVRYLLNKEIFLDFTKPVIGCTLDGKPSDSFDAYSNWNALHPFGKEAVFSSYSYSDILFPMENATQEDRERLKANLEQNVLQTARAYPDVTFYFTLVSLLKCWSLMKWLLKNFFLMKIFSFLGFWTAMILPAIWIIIKIPRIMGNGLTARSSCGFPAGSISLPGTIIKII